MSAPGLHRCHYSFSCCSFTCPHIPHFPEPLFFKTPKTPQNHTKTSISTRIPFHETRRNFRHFVSSLQSSDSEQEPNEQLEEAREAIREYLEKVGASTEDASHISSNCPSYLNMLIDGVNELDDWNSLAAASSGDKITGDTVEFKKKVYQMAEQKRDNGVIPFLVSLGLSLPSATHLARYLSSSKSNTLPLLIHKVKYVKGIFFSDSDDDYEEIAKNARRMMSNLSISADDDLQQTLAFFQKIQARRGGLSMLGSESTSFRCLIESFPHLLFLPLESRLKPVLKFLEYIKVPKGSMRSILLFYPPVLTYEFHTVIRPRLQKLKKVDANNDDIRKMLLKYPWILSASVVNNLEIILDFFDQEKVPRICSSHAIKRWPQILGSSTDKLIPMVKQLYELGIEDEKLGKVIADSPSLLLRKPQEFVQVVSLFRNLGLEEGVITQILARCPDAFESSIDGTLKRKLYFLYSIGITKSRLPTVIRKYPELFVSDVDAMRTRLMYLKEMGLSDKDISGMVSRFSPLLRYNVEGVLRPKLQFLLNTMKRPITEVVDYPRYFSYCLEQRIMRRHYILKQLEMEVSLKDMLGMNDEEFAEVYLGFG